MSVRSMTAYGRATSAMLGPLCWEVEVHSVNRRGLDLTVQLPRDLLYLDIDLRKAISDQISRGQVTVKVSQKKGDAKTTTFPLLKKMKSFWEQGAKELGYIEESIDLPFLMQLIEKAPLGDFGVGEEEIRAELLKTLDKALLPLVKMKNEEGKALAQDIKERIELLGDYVTKIEEKTKGISKKYREKLLTRIEDVVTHAAEDERILKEVALFAEKSDITEEIVRLKSHFKQVGHILASKERSVGRNLDFLVQEMLREINTIASKSGEIEVTEIAVSSKAELEKIREQVQNIE